MTRRTVYLRTSSTCLLTPAAFSFLVTPEGHVRSDAQMHDAAMIEIARGWRFFTTACETEADYGGAKRRMLRTNVFQVEQLADGGGALGAEAAGLGVIGDAGELSGTLPHNN